MEELRLKVIDWAKDRGIMEKATPATQATKILEECLELVIADLKQDKDEIKDACGDILVTLIIEASLLGLNLDELLPESINNDHIDPDFQYSPWSILTVATNIYGAVTEDYDRYNPVDRFIQMAYVRLMVYCHINELNLTECLQLAYDVISKRKGKMVNGVFVKDE